MTVDSVHQPPQREPPTRLEQLARTTAGNSHAHMAAVADETSPNRLDHLILAASGFTIAASYWCLVNPQQAVRYFALAARTYRELRHDYWIPLSMAAVNTSDLASAPSYVVKEAPTPIGVAFGMIAETMSDENRDHSEELGRQWRHLGNIPVGRLRIPLDLYGSMARAMRWARLDKNESLLIDSAVEYVRRAAEVIRFASHDRYHWSRYFSAILPAEPEAVAVTTALSVMAQRAFDAPLSDMLGNIELGSHGSDLVRIGDDLHSAAGRE